LIGWLEIVPFAAPAERRIGLLGRSWWWEGILTEQTNTYCIRNGHGLAPGKICSKIGESMHGGGWVSRTDVCGETFGIKKGRPLTNHRVARRVHGSGRPWAKLQGARPGTMCRLILEGGNSPGSCPETSRVGLYPINQGQGPTSASSHLTRSEGTH